MAQKKKNAQPQRTPAYTTDSMLAKAIVGLLLIALGVLIFLADVFNMPGTVFEALRQFSFGLTGMLAYVLPVLPIWGGGLLLVSTRQKAPWRPFWLTAALFVLCSAAATLLTRVGTGLAGSQSLPDYISGKIPSYLKPMSAYLNKAYEVGYRMKIGGGLLGMLPAYPLWKYLGDVMGAVVAIIASGVDFLFLIRLDWRGIYEKSKASAQEKRAQREQQRAQREQEAYQRQQEALYQQQQEALRRQQMQAQQQQMQPMAPVQPMPPVQPVVPAQPMSPVQPAPVYAQPSKGGCKGPISKQPTYGFQPSPEELGQVDAPSMAPQYTGDQGGLFDRAGSKHAKAVSRRKAAAAQAENTMPQDTADFPEVPARRRNEVPRFASEDPTFAPLNTAPQPVVEVPVRPVTAPQPVVQEEEAPIPADGGFTPEEEKKQPRPGSFLARLRAAKRDAGIDVPEDEEDIPARAPAAAPQRPSPRLASVTPDADPDWDDIPPWEDAPTPAAPKKAVMPVVTAKAPEGGYEPPLNLKPSRSGNAPAPKPVKAPETPYVFPGMDLLNSPAPMNAINAEEDAQRALRLEQTLQSFKVPAKVRNITHGPTITRFELEIAQGIMVRKVTDLNRNIAMNMEVKSVRIEAPIPGKSLVGVEVPNATRTVVTLREVLESDAMRKAKKPLVVALGQDIAGEPILCDLAKMPHLLIAGATGSGKSVCINTIITSLIYRCSPKDVRLILIDPKVVELNAYNSIPHLLIPVVTDPQKASGALAWAVGEMMDRYKQFETLGVRNIDGYNAALPKKEEKMPRIVIIIDELADLMMVAKKDVDERICRLAQLARAAGIHLIVATQRPSVDVITGTIKANIPSRIAFKVSSGADSRTILDHQGAETLLNYGDMLYAAASEESTIRVQGCLLEDAEIARVTDYIKENCPSEYDANVLEELDRITEEASASLTPVLPTGDENINTDASLIVQCVEMAVLEGQLSTSTIQRRLKLGYARAGRLMDELEDMGVVSAKDGSKPRECLISREEFEVMKQTGQLDEKG